MARISLYRSRALRNKPLCVKALMREFQRYTLLVEEAPRKTDRELMGSLKWAYLLISLPAKNSDRSSPEVMNRAWTRWMSAGLEAEDKAAETEDRRFCLAE